MDISVVIPLFTPNRQFPSSLLSNPGCNSSGVFVQHLSNELSLLKTTAGSLYVAAEGVIATGAVLVGVFVGVFVDSTIGVKVATLADVTIGDGVSLGVIVSGIFVGEGVFDAVTTGVEVLGRIKE